jgi:membrane protein YdbS with pleckstrin-like domain
MAMTSGSTERPIYEAASELAYHQSVHRAQLQSAGLDDLRTRASTVLTVSALVATFFVGQAAQNGLSTLGWAALIVFGAVVVVSVAILFPTKGWVFSLPPKDMVRIRQRAGGGRL